LKLTKPSIMELRSLTPVFARHGGEGAVLKRVMAFADGENLVFRYQELLKSKRLPNTQVVVHEPDAFVWSSQVTLWTDMDLLRVTYYTSVVGDDQRVAQVEQRIANTRFSCRASGAGYTGSAQLIPRVHKKPAASRKTKVVDVDITMDVMRAAVDLPVDGIYLLTGDGDYLPLVREITRRTSKQVYLGAFSSGLADELRSSVDNFVELDGMFFR
jgi:uncharacterized LabA/DUF88 family protein